jgi:hypothetical protein
MRLKIYLYCVEKSISASIKKVTSGHYLKSLLKMQRFGMAAIAAESGTKIITKTTKKSFIEKLIFSAHIAAINLLALIMDKISFAKRIVSIVRGFCLALIMKIADASFVALNFLLINICAKNAVQESARCVSLSTADKSDTYCLRVPKARAFAVESGIIVHNCTRYLVMSGIEKAKTKPLEAVKKVEYYTSSGSSTGWLG